MMTDDIEISDTTEVTFKQGMSHVTKQPVFGVSDKAQYKPGCAATEDG